MSLSFPPSSSACAAVASSSRFLQTGIFRVRALRSTWGRGAHSSPRVPAALATKLERPLFAACITYENETPTGADVRVRCVGPINADGQEHPDLNRVEALTQAWVDEFAAMMATKAQDWHMMQRVYVEDLDPERLARARAEHERKNR